MAIGEYIHFRYTNYLKYGLSEKSEGAGNKYAAIKIGQAALNETKTLSNANKAFIKQMEQACNNLKNLTQVTNVKNMRQDLRKKGVETDLAFIKKLSDIRKLENRVIDWTTGQAIGPGQGGMGAKQKIGEVKGFHLETLQDRAKNLEKKIKVLQGMMSNLNQLSSRLEEYARIEQQAESLAALAKNFLKQNGNEGWVSIESLSGTKYSDLAKNINIINQTFSDIGIGIDTATEGEIGEIVAGLGAMAVAQTASEEIESILWTDQALKSSTANVVKSNRVKANFNLSGSISPDIAWKSSGTKQKVDVTITFKDKNREPLRFSVKNVNLSSSSSINIGSGVSLIQLLQDDEDFLNHWLNIVPSRTGGSYKQFNYEGYAKTIHNTMKALIAMRALTGGNRVFRNNKGWVPSANALFVLNNANGEVKGYDMGEIANLLGKNISLAKSISIGADLNSITNAWSGNRNFSMADAHDRISAMVQALHSMNYDVSLPVSILNQVR